LASFKLTNFRDAIWTRWNVDEPNRSGWPFNLRFSETFELTSPSKLADNC